MIGFINVYKPQEVSSAFVVGKIKKQFHLNKVGHMGTLDPLACGILPIAIGKATRMFDYFLNKQKTYVVCAQFGYETLSLDLGTEKVAETNIIPTLEQIVSGCKMLEGDIRQIPPKFSAKNINGKKAYDLARNGVEFELKPSNVKIFSFKCLEQTNYNTFKFEITCSSGTYVRSLIRDLAYNLNSLATVTFLERTKTDYFSKENSITLEDLLNSNLECNLIKITDTFKNINKLEVSVEQFVKLKQGVPIETNYNNQDSVFILNNNNLLGVAQIKDNLIKLKTYLLED